MPTIQPQINPELKFTPPKTSVVSPPAVYQYSIHEELRLGERQYRKLLKSAWAGSKKPEQPARWPKITFNIIKALTAGILAYGAFRYRRSLPFLKKLFKEPSAKPVPNFPEEMKALYRRFRD